MVVLEFRKITVKRSQSEKEESDHAFRRVMSNPGTPIYTAMAYCHYVQTDAWDNDMRHFKTVVDETHDLHDWEAK